MVEETKTWGSIETSRLLRNSLASKSGRENLNNRTFCELFPDLVELIKIGKVPTFDQMQHNTVDVNDNDDLLSVSSESWVKSIFAIQEVYFWF